MLPFAEHSCGESMLKCIDCNAQICPKCLVQCPVGNRCPNCSKRFTSHVLKIDGWVILRCFIGGLVAGLLFSLLQVFIPLGGFFMLFFVYLFGVFVGNILFKFTGRKLGGKVAATIAAGIFAGSLCVFLLWQSLFGLILGQIGTPEALINSMPNQAASPISLSLIIFMVGAVSPFLGWNLPWLGFRR